MTRPLPRFLLLGIALFLADSFLGGDAGAGRTPAPPGTQLSDDELLFREALLRGYHESDGVVRMRLARNMRFAGADEERSEADLVDEALDLGMHESDLVVRRRLIQKLNLLGRERGRHPAPTEEELQTYLDAHPERWRRPERVTLSQLFFRSEEAANATEGQLPESVDPEDPALRALPHPLPIPHHLPQHAERDLTRLLGPDFARTAFGATDRTWSGPIRSAYGHHWVYIHERTPGGPIALDAVRTEVRESLLAERGAQALETWIAELRARYQLPPPDRDPAGGES
ncbi:MAG: peptidyl-prolyl cis-trans isomerase [bacterium]|nr:peptidyl-prolyl cis-trans isomerase [bacterium]MCP5066000.1 peptidyl-prolyl cis-trans isomerase [bacterium]